MEDQTCEEGRSRTKKTPRLLIWTPWGLKGDGNGGREASKEGVLGGEEEFQHSLLIISGVWIC